MKKVSLNIGLHSVLIAVLSLTFSTAGYCQGTKRAKSKPVTPDVTEPQSPSISNEQSQTELKDSEIQQSSQVTHGRKYGFGTGISSSSNNVGEGFVGIRFFVSPTMTLGANILLSNDTSKKSSSFGLGGRLQNYVAKKDSVELFYFAVLKIGQATVDGRGDSTFGLGGGFGAEYTLLKDLSISYDFGIGMNTLPEGKTAVGTGTSLLTLNIYY